MLTEARLSKPPADALINTTIFPGWPASSVTPVSSIRSILLTR